LKNARGKIQTIEQQQAADALRAVRELEQDNDFRERYRSYVERLGPSILINGLGQALAAEKAAGTNKPQKPEERAHHCLYQHLTRWLCRDGGIYSGCKDVLTAIVNHGEPQYLRAQAEALAWLVWHKKFCRAYLPASETTKD
jgi:CRISPR-associated protein Cmr5